MDDFQRQIRIAILAILIIVPIGIIGFMLIEGWDFLRAAYTTIITLSTIGYGDNVPQTDLGKIFTIFLVLTGLGTFAFAGQATIGIISSPVLRNVRQRRRTQNAISKLQRHYIICGMGELVDKTVGYLLQGAENRRQYIQELQFRPIDQFLDRIFGDAERGHFWWLRQRLRSVTLFLIGIFRAQSTILDAIVVITQDAAYAEHLRNSGLLVVEGNPSSDNILREAGIKRAQSLVVLLDSDTETLLTVLTARTIAPPLHITAAVLDEDLSHKMTRVGANAVINPFDSAGQFLNNATFRPAVSDYFNGVLFEHSTEHRITQLELFDDSPWIGQPLGALNLREKHRAGVIGVQYDDLTCGYAPSDDYVLQEDDTLIVTAPAEEIEKLKRDCRGEGTFKMHMPLYQPLPLLSEPISSSETYSLVEAERAIEQMSKHFIICGTDQVARSAISRLNPERPFVIISHDNTFTSELLKRGFRVVHGNPTSEETLLKAGVKRAQAIMVALTKKADSVLTILSCRTLNKRLLITTTSNSDDMIDKLERAGADRVVSPFHVAARFILLTTTRPKISDFLIYVLYNYQSGLETTEIYMENDSVWIGKTIEELDLQGQFDAGVIGVRLADQKTFIYAPPPDYVINPQEVLIIVTPMQYSDDLRNAAHGGIIRRPDTLRSRVLQSNRWSRDQIQKIMENPRL